MVCDSHKAFEPGQIALSVREVSFAYGAKEILRNVSFNVVAGRLTGLLGPNGSGKTTLFRCCLGLLKPAGGSILLGGKPLSGYSPRHLAAHVAYVPQEHQPAFPFLVREMVEMGRTPYRRALPVLSSADHHAVAHALERVGLEGLAEEPFHHLSGGQRQLVLVARALAQEASLLFLDEPTSSLDFSNQLTVWETVRALAAEGLGVVICCHDPNHLAWFCDDAVALKEGRALAVGPARDIITRPLLEDLYKRPVQTAQVDDRVFVYPA